MADTHRYYQTLKEAGFTDRQAEAMTTAFKEGLYGSLATKNDMGDLRAEVAGVRGEVADVRAEVADVRAEVADVRTELSDLRSEVKSEISGVRVELAALGGRMDMLAARMDTGFQRVFLQVSGTMVLFLALAEYVGRHFR